MQICKELNLIESHLTSKDILLPKLRQKLAEHPAFIGNSHLERLGSSFGNRIFYCPKYHCELNPIEGVWCYVKWFVRKNNDQDFKKFNELIVKGFKYYEAKKLNIKLWNRFWKAIDMYDGGSTYQEVLEELFGAKSSASIKSHKKITSFNTNLN